MKKMISVVLAGCLAVSLAACGSSSSTTGASSAASTASSATSTASSAASSEAASSEAASTNGAEAEAAAEGVTLTGEADGFGGTITATITKDGDTITAVTFDGPDETPDVGGAALETLAQQVVDANGVEIDGVSGATVTTEGCIAAAQAALDSEG